MTRQVVVAKIDREKLVVTQANKLAEASYFMTLEEKRVVLLMVSLVRQEDSDFKTYRIPIADIRDYLALRRHQARGWRPCSGWAWGQFFVKVSPLQGGIAMPQVEIAAPVGGIRLRPRRARVDTVIHFQLCAPPPICAPVCAPEAICGIVDREKYLATY